MFFSDLQKNMALDRRGPYNPNFSLIKPLLTRESLFLKKKNYHLGIEKNSQVPQPGF
jgi:hypothetical protein